MDNMNNQNIEYDRIIPENIIFKTDTGPGLTRTYMINIRHFRDTGETFRDLSKQQVGPRIDNRHDSPLIPDVETALIMAKKSGFQTVVQTSNGTFYLKCHRDEVERTELVSILNRNCILGYKGKSKTYLLT